MEKIKSIIIYGEGGDGVRFLAKRLIFTINAMHLNKYISYFFDYDATIKHGRAIAYISIDDKATQSKIAFRNCDILLSFREDYPNNIIAKKKILKIKYENVTQSFIDISLKAFRKSLYANMIAYAYLLKILDIPYKLENLNEINQTAVLLGDKIAGDLKYE